MNADPTTWFIEDQKAAGGWLTLWRVSLCQGCTLHAALLPNTHVSSPATETGGFPILLAMQILQPGSWRTRKQLLGV